MAFSNSNLSISLEFDLTNAPKDFSLTDNTDYSAETYSNILGLLKAVAPSGTQFYNNTNYASPDIDYGSSDTSGTLGSLPLVSSVVETGSYIFTYTVKIEDMLQSHTIVSNDSTAKTFTINGNYATQILSSTATAWECVDVVTTALTIVSATYSSSTGLTTVTIAETLGVLTTLAQFQWTVDTIFSKSFTQAYTYESPSVCLNWVNDMCCSSMTITDVTVYDDDATVTRLHTVHYPDGMVTPIANITSPLQELIIIPIWTGTWTDTFTASISAINGIITIADSIRGVKEHKVTSDEGICQIYTCITNMTTKYTAYLTTAPQKAIEMSKFIIQATSAWMSYSVGKQCGETGYEAYLDIISEIANTCGCGCDCEDCADGTPTQVVGCCENVGGSDFTIVLQSTNGSITISSNTVGTTTTFDIEVNGTWLTTQVNNIIAATSINALDDVNTGNIAAATGQLLIWNNGTGQWERGTAQLQLVQLTDVDGTGLANNMVLYYDSGSLTFKFKLIASPSIATCTDVTLAALANGQILKYNGTAWVNVNNYFSLLGDVNTTGIVDGSAFEWDSGTSKFIVFTPKKTLASLDDVVIAGIADNDRFIYTTGTGWQNIPRPTFGDLTSYQAGYTRGSAGFFDSGVMNDRISNLTYLRGVVSNGNAAMGAPQWIASVGIGNIPDNTVPFRCTVGIGFTNMIAIGEVANTTGKITIYSYYNSVDGVLTAGIPAGDISLDGIVYCINS